MNIRKIKKCAGFLIGTINEYKPTLKIHLNSSNIKTMEGVKLLGRCTIFYADIEMLENQLLKRE